MYARHVLPPNFPLWFRPLFYELCLSLVWSLETYTTSTHASVSTSIHPNGSPLFVTIWRVSLLSSAIMDSHFWTANVLNIKLVKLNINNIEDNICCRSIILCLIIRPTDTYLIYYAIKSKRHQICVLKLQNPTDHFWSIGDLALDFAYPT